MVCNIGIVPGDGIGPEVMDEVVPLLMDVARSTSVEVESTWYDWGAERYLREGELLPENGLQRLANHDAILVGAVGHPDVPDEFTLRKLFLPIRKRFDQYINKRPSVLFDGVESPLEGYKTTNLDFVIYRENTEGEYADTGGRVHQGFDNEVAIQSSVFTREGVERVARAAFEAASNRDQRVTNVTKSNVLAHSMVFWDEIVEDVSTDYPAVHLEHVLVDAATMALVNQPDQFDVVLASNLFGDILSDLGAAVTGSVGLAPSANLNPTGRFPSMFEPIHGSAPDIAGQGIANPLASVLSGAMLFEHCGEEEISNDLWNIVSDQLADPEAPRTPDVGGDASTKKVVEDLRNRVQ